jgi:hypothetical protein
MVKDGQSHTRLPRSPMEKRRRWWIWPVAIILPLLIFAAGVWFYRDNGIKRDLESWRNYQAAARARGEDLGIEAWLPPKVADSDNLFTHPWMLGFIEGESSPQAETVAALQPWPGLGLEDYELRVEDYESGKTWFDDKPTERERVLEAGRTHAKDLAAIHEMAARPGARLEVDTSRGYESAFGSWPNLSDLGHMLGLHAAAALSAGDEASAVADLEALLRLGSHFRGQNFLLPQIVGAGQESSALPVIETGALKNAFSPASKQRLRAARRSRKIEDELAASWRLERGMFLQTLESVVRRSTHSDSRPLIAFFRPPERLLAANSLAYCEMLDPALAPPLSVAAWQDFDGRITRIHKKKKSDDPVEIAHATFILGGNIVSGLLVQEEDIDRIFKLLDPWPPR